MLPSHNGFPRKLLIFSCFFNLIGILRPSATISRLLARYQEKTVADIFHDFPIKVPLIRVFQAVSTPLGLDCWWTKRSIGKPAEGAEYDLWFGSQYYWLAKVTRYLPNTKFELEILRADKDWSGTRVGFRLEARGDTTWVHFYHSGWSSANEHYKISCNCWAMYLRILRRYLEHGELVPYESRLDA
ncbi:MAG: SRPBCC domain-containing protein [Deltaproteobacteria bacterium]|nr:SRPBCC domain-containing protein [Deltaproteobacteria bacterium]